MTDAGQGAGLLRSPSIFLWTSFPLAAISSQPPVIGFLGIRSPGEASETNRGGSTMQCECSDQNCPVHPGRSQCDSEMTVTLFRVDTDDQTGTARCDGCARDAVDSGLFVTEDDF